MMRAKMKVVNVQSHDGGNETIKFRAIGKDSAYPEDGTDEDNSYARWTPNGELSLTIANPELWGKFAIDDKFYLDFTRVT